MKERILSRGISHLLALLLVAPAAVQALPNITEVVQTGGDNNDPAQFTGQTFNHPNLGNNYTVPFFAGGQVAAFRDRNHEWTWAGPAIPWPSYLEGGEYVMSRNDNRDNANLTIAITITEQSWVYLLIDNRLNNSPNTTPPDFANGTVMGWVARDGFLPIMTGSNRTADNTRPDEIGVDEGADGATPGTGLNQWSSIYGKLVEPGTITLYQPDNPGRNMYGAVVKAVARQPRFSGGSGNLLGFTFRIEDGSVSQLNPESLIVNLDGERVTPNSVTLADGFYTVSYSSPRWFPSASSHSVQIQFSDNANPANTATANFSFTADTYPTIGAAQAVPASAVDQTSSGFRMRTVQYKDSARWPGNDLPNDTRRAEDQLAGRLLDPMTLQPIENFAVPNPEAGSGGWYNPTVINMSQEASLGQAGQSGSFVATGTATSAASADQAIPGIPGTDPEATDFTDNIAAEAIGYLQLSAGLHQFGVNSDDGFRVTAGRDPRAPGAVQLGVFSGGRGATDSLFYVEVSEAGIYPVRLIWYEGGGGASVEFFTRNYNTGMKTLVNDRDNGGVVSYSRASVPVLSTSVSPLDGQTGVTPRYTIQAQVYENGAALNANSVQMTLNGNAIVPTVTSANGVSSIVYEPTADHAAGVNTVTLSFSDDAGTPNTYSHTWTFTAVNPTTMAVIPAAFSVPIEAVNSTINGFLGDLYQMDNTATATVGDVVARTGFPNNNQVEAAEFQYARGFIDPATRAPWPNAIAAGPETDGRYWLDRINFNQQTGNAGNFNGGNGFGDALIPGRNSADHNWIVGEFTTYMELRRGHHRFVVNCDDGFKLTTAPDPRSTQGAILLGMRSPGGGSTDVFVDFFVEADGIYPMRLLWWEGTGGANLEFAYVDPESNARVLFGDYDRPLAPRVFPYYIGEPRPQLRSISPSGANAYPNAQIQAVITDLGNAPVTIDISGVDVPLTRTVDGNRTTLTGSYPTPFVGGATYNLNINYAGIPFTTPFTVVLYPTIAAGVGLPVSEAVQSASGFAARVFQANKGPNNNTVLPNTIARAESQIAGTLIDPVTGQPYVNEADPGTLGGGGHVAEYINWSQDSATATQVGNFQSNDYPDQPIPGIRDVTFNSDNIAAEIIGWLELPAGITGLGVNSDDGFKLTVGHAVDGSATLVGQFDGGRGSANSALAVEVPSAGLYPVRLVWFEGGGGANVEFYSVTPSGEKILVNDRTRAGHIKAYYRVNTEPQPDPTLSFTFSNGSISVTWANGTLQSRADLSAGSWQNVSGAQSGTHTESAAAGNKYFRVFRAQ